MCDSKQILKTIILGNHPLAADLLRQYSEMGCEATHDEALSYEVDMSQCSELVLLSSGDDNKVLTRLEELAEACPLPADDGERVICHLLVSQDSTLQMLHQCDLDESVTTKMDVYPFTIDEVWSRQLVLDREPITMQSDRHAHLVISGTGAMAQAVAINAALVSHYPNYVRDHSLRTRITVIATGAARLLEDWSVRYRHLFDNSYYRLVNPALDHAVVQLHRPMYEGRREDFVDVEWEFVDTSITHPVVQDKLELWSQDSGQLLTLVMADEDCDQNITEAIQLPDVLFAHDVPIHVYLRDDALLRSVKPAGKYRHLQPFGMLDRGYDVTLPWARMARTVNHIYDQFYQANAEHWQEAQWQMRYAVEIDPASRDRAWARLSAVKRQSSICNALTVGTKLRSIDLDQDEWDKFYDITGHDMELLAQVEHNRWSVAQLILGYRPCTDREQQELERDISLKGKFKADMIHYDLRAYSDLRADETGKSVAVYDLCLCAALPLIAKSFVQESKKWESR